MGTPWGYVIDLECDGVFVNPEGLPIVVTARDGAEVVENWTDVPGTYAVTVCVDVTCPPTADEAPTGLTATPITTAPGQTQAPTNLTATPLVNAPGANDAPTGLTATPLTTAPGANDAPTGLTASPVLDANDAPTSLTATPLSVPPPTNLETTNVLTEWEQAPSHLTATKL